MAEVWRPVSHRRLRPLGHGSPTWPLPRPPGGSLSRPGPPRQASCATERPLTRQFTSGLGLLHLERPTCHVPGTQLRPPAAQAARPRPSQSVCPHTDAPPPPPLTSVLGPGSRSPPSRCPFLGRTQGLKSIPTESHFNQRGVPRSTHVALRAPPFRRTGALRNPNSGVTSRARQRRRQSTKRVRAGGSAASSLKRAGVSRLVGQHRRGHRPR